MKTPLVSVLIPVYNVEKYLSRCLDSLINQTLTDIEIICVNDGSTDGSLKILKQYQEKDNRIVIVDKKNGGLPSARNAGLDRARGQYVGFVDSDDYVEPSMFETLYKTAKKKNSEVVICGAQIFPRLRGQRLGSINVCRRNITIMTRSSHRCCFKIRLPLRSYGECSFKEA